MWEVHQGNEKLWETAQKTIGISGASLLHCLAHKHTRTVMHTRALVVNAAHHMIFKRLLNSQVFCLESITLMHHMTPSWRLLPSPITTNSPLLTYCQTQPVGLDARVHVALRFNTSPAKTSQNMCIFTLASNLKTTLFVHRGIFCFNFIKSAQEKPHTSVCLQCCWSI